MKQLFMLTISIAIPNLAHSCHKTLIISPAPLRQQIRGVRSLEKLVSNDVLNSEKSVLEQEEEYNIKHFIAWPTSAYLQTDSDQSPSPTQSIGSDSDSPLSQTPSPKQHIAVNTQVLAKEKTDSLTSEPNHSPIVEFALFLSAIIKQCFTTDSSYNRYSAHTVN